MITDTDRINYIETECCGHKCRYAGWMVSSGHLCHDLRSSIDAKIESRAIGAPPQEEKL